jgi:hypothetical protein
VSTRTAPLLITNYGQPLAFKYSNKSLEYFGTPISLLWYSDVTYTYKASSEHVTYTYNALFEYLDTPSILCSVQMLCISTHHTVLSYSNNPSRHLAFYFANASIEYLDTPSIRWSFLVLCSYVYSIDYSLSLSDNIL